MLINKKGSDVILRTFTPFHQKYNRAIRKNFSLILCKNYGKIEEWPMGDSNPQPEI